MSLMLITSAEGSVAAVSAAHECNTVCSRRVQAERQQHDEVRRQELQAVELKYVNLLRRQEHLHMQALEALRSRCERRLRTSESDSKKEQGSSPLGQEHNEPTTHDTMQERAHRMPVHRHASARPLAPLAPLATLVVWSYCCLVHSLPGPLGVSSCLLFFSLFDCLSSHSHLPALLLAMFITDVVVATWPS